MRERETMYLPTNLDVIFTVTIRELRKRRDYWKFDQNDERAAATYNGKIWALMDVRDALSGRPSALVV